MVQSILKLLPQLEANLPSGIQVQTLTDLTTPIQASVEISHSSMITARAAFFSPTSLGSAST